MTYKKVVILGAGGFIGINLSHFLAEKGYDIVCFDRKESLSWPQNTNVIIGDFSSPPDELIDEMDNAIIFHLVTSSKPALSTINASNELIDVTNTISYLERTKHRNIRWIFLSSGGTIYGQGDSNFSEESPINPICSYGIVKNSIERYYFLYRALYGIDYRIIRLANPYGPWQSPFAGQGIIATILYKALHHQEIQIWGDGENIRDYIYISDVLEAFLSIVNYGYSGEVYNVGTGKGYTINQLVRIISEVVDTDIVVTYQEARSIDVKKNILDIEKVQNDTSWKHNVTIQQGLLLSLGWLLEQEIY